MKEILSQGPLKRLRGLPAPFQKKNLFDSVCVFQETVWKKQRTVCHDQSWSLQGQRFVPFLNVLMESAGEHGKQHKMQKCSQDRGSDGIRWHRHPLCHFVSLCHSHVSLEWPSACVISSRHLGSCPTRSSGPFQPLQPFPYFWQTCIRSEVWCVQVSTMCCRHESLWNIVQLRTCSLLHLMFGGCARTNHWKIHFKKKLGLNLLKQRSNEWVQYFMSQAWTNTKCTLDPSALQFCNCQLSCCFYSKRAKHIWTFVSAPVIEAGHLMSLSMNCWVYKL